MLVSEGWFVVGTTRSPEKAEMLRALGVEPMVVDVFDSTSLLEIVCNARPQVVMHQLTDLPDALDPEKMPEARIRNARIREVGTRNLVAAAAAAGANRMVAQSIAFAYAPGSIPYAEDAPLNFGDPASAATTKAVTDLEEQVLSGPFEGIVLRYGKLYGPGTGFDAPPSGGPVHVEAAADAALRAAKFGEAGIYNVAEEDGTISSRKAMTTWGWNPHFRVGANAR